MSQEGECVSQSFDFLEHIAHLYYLMAMQVTDFAWQILKKVEKSGKIYV